MHVVQYRNDLNSYVMKRWRLEEYNLFFSLMALFKNKGGQTLDFDIDTLKKMTNWGEKSDKRFFQLLSDFKIKMLQIVYFEESEEFDQAMTIFTRAKVDKSNRIFTVTSNVDFDYVLNRMTNVNGFTIFELAEFVALKSIYSKNMYRLIKQWKTQGKHTWSKKDLYALLDVPEGTQTTANFSNRVLKPIREELKDIFNDFEIITIKKGKKIEAYEFRWEAERYTKTGIKNRKKQELIPYWANTDQKPNQPQEELSQDEQEKLRAQMKEILKKD